MFSLQCPSREVSASAFNSFLLMLLKALKNHAPDANLSGLLVSPFPPHGPSPESYHVPMCQFFHLHNPITQTPNLGPLAPNQKMTDRCGC